MPRGINADAVWDTGPGGKITTRTAQFASEARETDADFDGLLVDWKEKGHTVTLEGKEPMTGWEGYKLKVTTKGGVVRQIYIDTKTFLDRRHTGTVTLPLPANAPAERAAPSVQLRVGFQRLERGQRREVRVRDRRGPGRPRDPAQSFATYTEKIEANVPMEDTIFAPPAPPSGGN